MFGWLIALLVLITVFLLIILGLLAYLVYAYRCTVNACPAIAGFPQCASITAGGSTYTTRPFGQRNLYFPQINAYLVSVGANYVYDRDAPVQGLWTYDGTYVRNKNGEYLGYTPSGINNTPTRWIFDGYNFYVTDSFIEGTTTVLAITGNNNGIIQVSAVPVSNVGQAGSKAVVVTP